MTSMKRIFVALDNMDKDQIFALLEKSNGKISSVKIGLELFNLYGKELVQEIYDKYQVEIFLDLKLHDIPNTVSKAIRSLEGLPISYLTLHLSGGLDMLKASAKMRDASLPKCKLLGVSILTSLNDEDIEMIWGITNTKDLFKNLFLLAKKSGIEGVVCSPYELEVLKGLDLDLESMCPGIRFQDEIDEKSTGDQKRVLSPSSALENGATNVVIGRSLTQTNSLEARIQEIEAI